MSDHVCVRARFERLENLRHALMILKELNLRHYEAYAPVSLKDLEEYMPDKESPVRVWATSGAFIGLFSFWFMCVAASLIYNIVVGGKPPWSNVPFVVVMYEGTILLGSLLAFFSGLVLARLWPHAPPSNYDQRYSGASFGVEVRCKPDQEEQIKELLMKSGAVEIYEY